MVVCSQFLRPCLLLILTVVTDCFSVLDDDVVSRFGALVKQTQMSR